MTVIRWQFWKPDPEAAARLIEAQEAACRVERVAEDHQRAVQRLVNIRRENHLGATFQKAYRGRIA